MSTEPIADLWGEPMYKVPEPGPLIRSTRKPTRPMGYAAIPGTGPKGETCRTCKFYVKRGSYRKCERMRPAWTCGTGSDILARSPACFYWEATTKEDPAKLLKRRIDTILKAPSNGPSV